MEPAKQHFRTLLLAVVLAVALLPACAISAALKDGAKQQSLDEWRALTAPTAAAPRVFVKGDQVRFYFPTESGVAAFVAHWRRARIPTSGYKVDTALLHWDQKLLRVPDHERSWRQATVIAGADWRHLATNLVAALTPSTPGQGAYYQAFLADRVLYRDRDGQARTALLSEQPKEIVLERRYSIEETLEFLAHLVEKDLATTHPGDSLFLLMAPNAKRFTQPLLLDRRQRRCVFLAPAALYDSSERGFTLATTAQGLCALLPESHGLALLKNPISSAARLADLTVATLIRFVRLPLPRPGYAPPPVVRAGGMDLAAWEAWLDRYTGTRLENGSLSLLIDGDHFFPRIHQAFAEATNHIRLNLYIFDRDDIGVAMADQLKQRSRDLDVKVILDRMSSVTAGVVPPSTPLPEDFVAPSSIISYLRQDSRVRVHPFLNPWLSSDHSKVLLVDGSRAWLGGMNFGREYRYEWHDLMVELQGPAVASLEREFQRQWAHAGPLGDLAYLGVLLSGPQVPSPPGTNDWMKLRLLPTRTGWKPFAAAVSGSLARAQKYIYAENPYLFDKRVILALVKARNRGVDVRVILPRVNDFKAGGRSNLVIANYLLAHGVRVFFYPGMTHVKALLVDDWACVGSGNLNHLSLRVNQEQNVATSDSRFVTRLKLDLFEEDFSRSYEMAEPISVDWMDFLADLVLEGF